MNYQIMFYVGIVGSIVMLFLTILIFIKNNIAEVISDLTGINLNIKLAGKNVKSVDRGKSRNTTEIKIKSIKKGTDNIDEKRTTIKLAGVETEIINSEDTGVIDNIQTEVLDDLQTEVIDYIQSEAIEDNQTELIDYLSEDETTLLSDLEEETTVLTQNIDDSFVKEVDVVVVNCEFVI